MTLSGLLNIDKPPGLTSRRVVDYVDRLVHPARSGHAGTLDPLATGVLVLCIGSATRLMPYVQQMRKGYRATFQLGLRSDTDDIEGDVQQVAMDEPPDEPTLRQVLQAFRGTIQQVPPNYSALKVKGKRAYSLAREQKPFQLAARPVTIYRLELLDYQFPVIQVDVECSSGTYIRALGRDLAAALGTSAVMSALIRTKVGVFRLDEACPLAELNATTLAERLLPASAAVAELPRLLVGTDEVRRLWNGQPIAQPCPAEAGPCAAFDDSGRLVAIVEPLDIGGTKPVRCFPSAD